MIVICRIKYISTFMFTATTKNIFLSPNFIKNTSVEKLEQVCILHSDSHRQVYLD